MKPLSAAGRLLAVFQPLKIGLDLEFAEIQQHQITDAVVVNTHPDFVLGLGFPSVDGKIR